MFKLDLEKAELPTSAGSLKKQESSRKTSTSALLTTPKPLTGVGHDKLWKILKEMEIADHLTCLLKNLYADQGATELKMEWQTPFLIWNQPVVPCPALTVAS